MPNNFKFVQDTSYPHFDADSDSRSTQTSKAQTKRMSLSMTGDIAQQLEHLAAIQGVSQNEILRRAIATEAYIQSEIASGSTILIQKKDGTLREVVFR